MIIEKRKNNRRANFYTRKTDIFNDNKRAEDRRESIVLEKKIIEKIEVRHPYFALSNFKEIENGLKANIPVEQPLWNEVEPITAGETARHLAILGSCEIALKRKSEKCFYLATKATYQRHINKIELKNLALIGTAKIIKLDKRKAMAHTELITSENHLITSLDVEYTILSSELFERQFKGYKLDLRKTDKSINRQNFYKQFAFDPELEKQKNDGILFDIGEIKPEMCMGHFPMYPALPVAFCSTMLINSAIRKIPQTKQKIYVESSIMTANSIIFAKSFSKISIKLLEQQDNLFVFQAAILEKNTNKILMELNPLKIRSLKND
jgi:hypothetical protein